MEPPPARGRFLRTTPADWQQLDTLWRGFIAGRNSQLERAEGWWRRRVFGVQEGVAQRDLLVWADDTGDWQGWLCFRETDLRPHRYGTSLAVRELVFTSSMALRQLLAFLFDEESPAAPAWEPDRVPCDTCGDHEVVLCPHCHVDYDPHGAGRLLVAPGAPPEPRTAPLQDRPPNTWPPISWR